MQPMYRIQGILSFVRIFFLLYYSGGGGLYSSAPNSPELTVVYEDWMELTDGVGVFCVCSQAFLQTHSRATEIASWSSLKSTTPSLWRQRLLSRCHGHSSFVGFVSSCRLKSLFYRSSNLQYFKRLIQIPQLPEVRTHKPVLYWLLNCSFHLLSTCIFCVFNSTSHTCRICDLNCAFFFLQNPPNFLRASALSEHISPVVLPAESSSPESEHAVETDDLVDTDVPAFQVTWSLVLSPLSIRQDNCYLIF